MSFTVLRVEVQQWEDDGIVIGLPVDSGYQSEEGVKADNVVEEEGHQEDCCSRLLIITPLILSYVRNIDMTLVDGNFYEQG